MHDVRGAGSAGPGDRPSVLVAVASPAERGWLAGWLTAAGVQARLAADGRQLLEQFVHGPTGLVLLDPQLPGLPAAEAIAFIRLQDWAVPIVLLAGGETAVELSASNARLPRPLDRRQVERTLTPWLPSAPAADQAATLADDLRALREDFVGRLGDAYLAPMQAAAIAHDWPRLRHFAHRLAGSAACHGLADLAAAASRLETLLLLPSAAADPGAAGLLLAEAVHAAREAA